MSDEEGQNESNDNHSENIEDSESEEEKKYRIFFNITINGKEIPLKIYQIDNLEQEVKQFCKKYNVSSIAQQALLQKVEEELERKSKGSENISNKSDIYYSNKTVREPKDMQTFAKSSSFKPKEKNRLEHIFNESETASLSESLNQSHKNLENLIREYNNEGNGNIYNQNKGKNIKNLKINNIMNDKNQKVKDSIFYLNFLFEYSKNTFENKEIILNEFFNLMSIIYNKFNKITKESISLYEKFINCKFISQSNKNKLQFYYNSLIN